MNAWPHRVRVKICGIRTAEEAEYAAQAGADAVGLNFYPPSPRYVRPEDAEAILRALPPFVEAVGIVVRPEQELLEYLVYRLGLVTLQIYDGEPPDSLRFVRYILATGIGDSADLQQAETLLDTWLARGRNVVGVLLDARVPGQYGGSGKIPPWSVVAQFSRRRPLILAGGLTPENVCEALRVVRPWAVDVASGVEKEPGVKDPDKMRRFVHAVHGSFLLP
ncbi:MAG: phosphoribosylanthranilate isomerase [Gemmatales bacterium]|nr:phosphoribosylanthranilate isomerase [Gemmatales bacterium]MDW7993589.1 phosphoribosylanthranilate isomerase [Gemmatales bacterium]